MRRSEHALFAPAGRRSRSIGADPSRADVCRGPPVAGRADCPGTLRRSVQARASVDSAAERRKDERARGRSPRRRMENRRPGPDRPQGWLFGRCRPRRLDGEVRRRVQVAPAVGMVGAGDDRRERGRFATRATRTGTGRGGTGRLARLEGPHRVGRVPGRSPAGDQEFEIVMGRPKAGRGRAAVVAAGLGGPSHEGTVAQEQQQCSNPPASPSLETDASHCTPVDEPGTRREMYLDDYSWGTNRVRKPRTSRSTNL
mgnify:CR=1 FL=1